MAEKKQTGGTGKRAKSEKPAVLSGTVPEWSSTTVISQLLGKTVRRVQQLTQEGVLETEIPPGGGARKYRTCATIQRYVAYVEAKAQETGENSRAAELTLKKLEAEVELKESQGQYEYTLPVSGRSGQVSGRVQERGRPRFPGARAHKNLFQPQNLYGLHPHPENGPYLESQRGGGG